MDIRYLYWEYNIFTWSALMEKRLFHYFKRYRKRVEDIEKDLDMHLFYDDRIESQSRKTFTLTNTAIFIIYYSILLLG